MTQNLSAEGILMNSSNSGSEHEIYSTGIRISFTVMFAVVVVAGTCGNSLVIVAVKLKKVSQTSTNFLLANLAVADVTTLVSAIPNAVVLFHIKHHPAGAFGTVLCKFITFGTVSLMTSVASVLTLMFISWERYRAIAKPLQLYSSLKLTEKNVKYAIAVVWVVAFIYALPLIVTTNHTEQRQKCLWLMDESEKTVYIGLFLALFYFIPVAAMCYSYLGIVRAMYSENGAKPGGVSRKEDLRAKLKIVKTLMTVTVIFMVCLGIFGSSWLMFYQNQISDIAFRVSVFFLLLNAAVNPLIYTLQSTSYRHAFKELLKRCCRL